MSSELPLNIVLKASFSIISRSSDPLDPVMADDNEDIILTAARPADIQIPKLSPTNYKVWNDLVVGLLDGRGLGGYTTGTVKKPTKPDQLRI
jgi:hypothetical protein